MERLFKHTERVFYMRENKVCEDIVTAIIETVTIRYTEVGTEEPKPIVDVMQISYRLASDRSEYAEHLLYPTKEDLLKSL